MEVRQNLNSCLLAHCVTPIGIVTTLTPHPLHKRSGVQDVLDVSICETREEFPEEIDVLVNSTTNLHKLGFNENVPQEPEHLAELFDMGP